MKKLSTVGIIEYTEITLNGAKQFLCIVSPYLNIKNDYLTLIKAKAKKGIKVVIICGKTALSESELKKLQQIKNLELRFLYDLPQVDVNQV
jgi:phosphatidylserine/phosphatidylglycerophosphate/cardiolipin synthase-like enzyme